MNFFNWLKNLFRKKEPLIKIGPELEEIEWQGKINKQEREIQKEREDDKIRLLEKRKETIEVKKTKSQFQDLVDNIESNRESIVKSQEENLPQVKGYGDRVEYLLKGVTFIFCKEGYRLFEDDFYKHKKYYDIIIDNDYLARQHKERNFIQ